jgi:hypothetical protein
MAGGRSVSGQERRAMRSLSSGVRISRGSGESEEVREIS